MNENTMQNIPPATVIAGMETNCAFICAHEQYNSVCMLINAATVYSKKQIQLFAVTTFAGDFKLSPKTCPGPPPPFHKTHPLDLKSK